MNPANAERRAVVVLGGGVAGIAAAVRLAQAGQPVTLIEMRPRLGGRATSVTDPSTGDLIDNCQHVVMRCCTALGSLYESLGVSDQITWHRRFHFLHRDGSRATLDRGVLPAPLHFVGAFARFKGLSWADRAAIGMAMGRIVRMTLAQRHALNDTSFAVWLEQQRQPRRAIERFWEVTVVSACNERLDRVAAGYAIQVFAEGLLAGRRGYEMGLSRVPLAKLYDAAGPIIEKAGGRLRLSSTVRSLTYDAATRQVAGVTLNDGECIDADAVIVALPFDALRRVVSLQMIEQDPRLQRLDALEVSPILGLHLWVRASDGRPALSLPHVVLTGSPLHWLFNHGSNAAGVQHLHGVASAANALIDRPNDELLNLAMTELGRVLATEPARRSVVVERMAGRVFKERRATFALRPGVDALRPTTRGTIRNLMLAGDWCATGWPATMEGAARSGYDAAEAVLGQVDELNPSQAKH